MRECQARKHVGATVTQEIVEKFPWVPTNLAKAFEEAKQIAYRRMADPRTVPLAWMRTAFEEQEAVLGRDPWSDRDQLMRDVVALGVGALSAFVYAKRDRRPLPASA